MQNTLIDELQPYEMMRFYRTRAGLTQEAIAIALSKSQMYVSRLERGQKIPDEKEISIIEKKLNAAIWSRKGKEN
ncbi:hypothetical protein AM501_23950 [Aneurinibacillus migulanus]|uniref:helix-turn-helix domain-containing protein n=1 Tax=Aneurinibacillus migulanus TaxID=47500 RepID=UPI0005BCACB4|nr:helix-turn-helix transcriptional regulator [Aneurinibacillus migulanus]KIV58938.1 hypothetical protein TS64_04030 [Aneurinibacillus migulanus]KPD05830.1 hypothetical protein AM501_23950 [Aneurinibacillus migulanus]